ncbi:MAG: hypothetical protein U5K56_18135 [Halioglobus sp.]|nr:hypothetical protein [Halioglobus sp.]
MDSAGSQRRHRRRQATTWATLDLTPGDRPPDGTGPGLWTPAASTCRRGCFYRQVDDYIQGVPATDPAVVAVQRQRQRRPHAAALRQYRGPLLGADLDFGVQLTPRWRVDGSASLVRAERRDIDDRPVPHRTRYTCGRA